MRWEEAAFPQVTRGVYGTRVHEVTLAAAYCRPGAAPCRARWPTSAKPYLTCRFDV